MEAKGESSQSLGFLMTGGKKLNVSCRYCKRDIAQQCRIRCAVCPDFELCHDCFSAGVSFAPHEASHAYRVVDCLDFPMFSKDWFVSEELLLLEGIEKFGMGNWKIIADYIGTKNIRQVEEHYWECYMGVHGYCLPQKTLIDGKDVLTESLTPVNDDNKNINNPATTVIKSEGSATASSSSDTLRIENAENQNALNRKYCGYDASTYVDGNLRAIPYTKGYARGEDVVRDGGRDIAPVGAHGHGGRRASTEKEREKDRQEQREKIAALPGSDLPGFMPLREDFDYEYENDAELLLADMDIAVDDHPSERELKLQVIRIYNHKLDERNRRKRFAIDRGLVDIKKQANLDRRRSKEEREIVSRLRVFMRFHSAEDHEALVDGLLRTRRLRLQIEALQMYRKMGIRTMEQARKYEIDRKKKDISEKSKKLREQTPYLFETGRSCNSNGGSDGEDFSRRDGREGVSALVGDRGPPVDMEKAPGYELLGAKEIELCTRLPMLPMHYLALKDVLVREAFRNGALTPAGMRRVLRIDPKATLAKDRHRSDPDSIPKGTAAAGSKDTPSKREDRDADGHMSAEAIIYDFFVRELALGPNGDVIPYEDVYGTDANWYRATEHGTRASIGGSSGGAGGGNAGMQGDGDLPASKRRGLGAGLSSGGAGDWVPTGSGGSDKGDTASTDGDGSGNADGSKVTKASSASGASAPSAPSATAASGKKRGRPPLNKA
jgi:transcriptional adapter 2-alpha